MDDFERRAALYHHRLPGLIRATLIDHGVSASVIDHRLLGWDGEYLTIPVRNRLGRVVFFERWDGTSVGVPVDDGQTIELYGWEVLRTEPPRVFLAEGIYEALVLQSHGIPAVSATGSGRFFKRREWGPALLAVPQVVLAYRRGERKERRRYLLTRHCVVERARQALPDATIVTWPDELGDDGGAAAFFVTHRRSVEDLETLIPDP